MSLKVGAQVSRSLKITTRNRYGTTFQSLNASVARWHSAVHSVIGKKYLLEDSIVTTSLRTASQVENSRARK